MNDSRQTTQNDDGRLLDLLVDGELGGPQRRELLLRLDTEPDGWRRCALAFLEAQAWRHGVESVVREPAPTGVTEVPASAAVGRPQRVPSVTSVLAQTPSPLWGGLGRGRRVRSVTSVLALAAMFLVAFGLGWTIHEPQIVQQFVPAGGTLASAPSDPPGPSVPREPDAGEPAVSNEQLPAPPIRAVGVLTWSIDENGTERKFAMPVMEGPGIDEEWLRRQPSVVPASLRRTLESRGHHVEEHREFISLPLDDGRQLLVPVNQVEVRFANRVYQ